MNAQFEREVIDRLARIEEKLTVVTETLQEHIVEDDERFQQVFSQLHTQDTALAVARAEGRRSGAYTGAGLGAVVVATLELLRHVFA